MSDHTRPKSTVHASASVTFRQKPDLLLMVLRVRAAEATLEVGMATLKNQCTEASARLTRLGAATISVGEPHGDDQAEADPTRKMQIEAMAMSKRFRVGEPTILNRRGINVALSATWDISKLTAVETLSLVDHLEFEVAADAEVEPEDLEPPPTWANPEEQMRAMMAKFNEAPREDLTPKFLYIAQVDEHRQAQAVAEAFALAREKAEHLAEAAGRRLGELATLHPGYGSESRMDRVMEKQRCSALLSAICFDLKEGMTLSEDARAVEFTASVMASFHLE